SWRTSTPWSPSHSGTRTKTPTGTSLKAMTHTPKDKTGRGELIQLVVDLGSLANNTRFFADFVAPAQLMAVVKADGYNHGALRIAQTALDHGAAVLGVATVPEALLLREAGPVKDGEPATIFAWMWEPAMDLSSAFAAERSEERRVGRGGRARGGADR